MGIRTLEYAFVSNGRQSRTEKKRNRKFACGNCIKVCVISDSNYVVSEFKDM